MAEDTAQRALLCGAVSWYHCNNSQHVPYIDSKDEKIKVPCQHCGDGIVIQCYWRRTGIQVVQTGVYRHEIKCDLLRHGNGMEASHESAGKAKQPRNRSV